MPKKLPAKSEFSCHIFSSFNSKSAKKIFYWFTFNRRTQLFSIIEMELKIPRRQMDSRHNQKQKSTTNFFDEITQINIERKLHQWKFKKKARLIYIANINFKENAHFCSSETHLCLFKDNKILVIKFWKNCVIN